MVNYIHFFFLNLYLTFILQVLPLEQEMKKPKQFSTAFGVLNVGMVIVTSLIVLTGFMGYWRFGDSVRGSLTLNLPEEFL